MNKTIVITSMSSPLGSISLASDGDKLMGLWFDGQTYDRASLKGQKITELDPEEADKLQVFGLTKKWLKQYFEERIIPDFLPPLKLEGTAFRQMVWEILLTIPYGETMTYGEIGRIVAERMGKKRMSAQAVGGAVGHNPVGIVVPCHRVIGSDGSLTGYAGGLDKKTFLLELERDVSQKCK